MAIPDEKVVRDVLTRHDRGMLCGKAVEDAWTTVKSDYPNLAWYRRKSTRRALVWEHSVQNAISALSDAPGVAIIQKNDTRSFILDDTVLLRFKKASLRLLSSNYPTLSSLLYHRHEADLFGHEGYHRVEVVHVFDRIESNLDWVGVVGREGWTPLWNFELPSGGAVVKPFPETPTLRPAADRVLRPVERETDKSDDVERD